MIKVALRKENRITEKIKYENWIWIVKLIKIGGRITNKTLAQLSEEFANAPTSQREYMIDGRRYIVISHYTGKKDVNKVIREIAIKKAYADMDKITA